MLACVTMAARPALVGSLVPATCELATALLSLHFIAILAGILPPLLKLPCSACADNVWIGSSADGSSSGLHHDFHDNLYSLLRGRKRFRLCKALTPGTPGTSTPLSLLCVCGLPLAHSRAAQL